MRRALGAFLIAGLLMGAAACGSSGGDDAKKSDSTESSSDSGSNGDSGGETTDSSNADVKAYCDAVDEYVQKAKDAMNDPAKAQALTDEAAELTEKATALGSAGLDAEDAQKVADCTKKSTDALMPS
ncbi:MAG TPA: hypothetical protein VNS19_21135 [Acidimicrobiales bacterium]|jgi:hypothetical protein|nr:hypothetical protein [Acidimicrobiales bacterium]